MTLSEAIKGEHVKVVGYGYGRGFAGKLARLGIHIGDELAVLDAAPAGGPILVEVAISSLHMAVGRGMADKLEVERVDVARKA